MSRILNLFNSISGYFILVINSEEVLCDYISSLGIINLLHSIVCISAQINITNMVIV